MLNPPRVTIDCECPTNGDKAIKEVSVERDIMYRGQAHLVLLSRLSV